jgi:hypothetical protein
MASDTAAIAQRGFAAFGGVSIQETMLAFAPDFRRLILTFHFIIKIKEPLPRFSWGATPPPAANPRFRV